MDIEGIEDYLVIHASQPRTALVIFIHGLGQSNKQWKPRLQPLVEQHPFVEWILPQALSRPVTFSEGQLRPSWFDIASLPPAVTEYDEAAITTSVSAVETLILAKIREGVPAQRIVLAGFSQGAALSMMASLTTLNDLGGVASLSGWIPHRMREMVHTAPLLPIFWGHGDADDEIPLFVAEEAVKFLKCCLRHPEVYIRFVQYHGLSHAVSDEEILDFGRWLVDRFDSGAESAD